MTLAPQPMLLALSAAVLGAAVLALLQLLKVQPPRRTVATVIFWRHATEQEHRRVLWGRFSRWRSFALLLLIVLLLAGALTGLRWPAGQRGEPVVMVVDTGFSMGAMTEGRTRLIEAIERIRSDVSQLGNRPVAVVLARENPELAVGFGQPAAVISPSLGRVNVTPSPSNSAATLLMAAHLLPQGKGRIYWYTDRAAIPVEMTPDLRGRITRRVAGTTARNAAILGVTTEPDAAGDLFCRMRVRVGAWSGVPQSIAVRLARSGRSEVQEAAAVIGDSGFGDALFSGLPADGQECQITLAEGGAVSADDRATIRLPLRRPVVFGFESEVADALRKALEAMQVGTGAGSAASIAVGTATTAGHAPLAVVVADDGQEKIAGSPADLVPGSSLVQGLSLEGAVSGQGADVRSIRGQAEIIPLIRAGGSVLAATSRDGTKLYLSDALFAPGSTVPQRPAFMILLHRALREMAGWTEAAASVPLERCMEDPSWQAPGRGSFVSVTGSRSASDLRIADSPDATTAPADTAPAVFPIDPWQLLLLLAMGLLVVEAFLQIRGRIV